MHGSSLICRSAASAASFSWRSWRSLSTSACTCNRQCDCVGQLFGACMLSLLASHLGGLQHHAGTAQRAQQNAVKQGTAACKHKVAGWHLFHRVLRTKVGLPAGMAGAICCMPQSM